ncbi:MAG: hypothetical protein JXA73_16935 [Acidobacteria bacterium]|nr:hypothetical protein [Acidobacteriota bacterium]
MGSPIADFVHDALMRGVSREDIVRELEKGGWSSKEIRAALEGFVDSDLPLPVPRKRVSSSPKEAFMYLMLFASLYTAAFGLASVLFDLINLSLPQPGEFAQRAIISLRYGIASTVVAFPLFLFMCRVIAGESIRNPGQRISPVRRWLTYLTLFIASVSIISDLITLIVRFLAGDLTLRFVLKVLVVAVLAGAVFIYYLRDLRRDEIAPSAEFRLTRAAQAGFAIMLLAVLVTLGFGFWYAGSPMKARMLAQDAQRVEDLIRISNKVQLHYRNNGVLPESLDACDHNPATFVDQKRDRVTGQPYLYHVKDATHFEVGAGFALPSDPSHPKSIGSRLWREEDGFWEHGAGPAIFTIDATRKMKEVY